MNDRNSVIAYELIELSTKTLVKASPLKISMFMPEKHRNTQEVNENGIGLVKQTALRKGLYGLKALRNYGIKSIYEAAHSRDTKSLMDKLTSRSPSSLSVAVAYNTPWTIDLLVKCWKKHCIETPLLIVDNSKKDALAQEIREICERENIYYLRLPHNREWHPSRSHGLALNWTWKNLICKIDTLNSIGFIDHDCYPISPWSPDLMPSKVAYGVKSPGWLLAQKTWSLWAGYMYFRNWKTQKVSDLPMDFTPNPLDGLDTAGMNWRTFYQNLSPEEFGFSKVEKIKLRDLLDNSIFESDVTVELIDSSFIHLGGAAYKAVWSNVRGSQLARVLQEGVSTLESNWSTDDLA